MDEIEYITQSPFFVNRGGNPIELDPVLNRLYSLVDRDILSEESPEFIYYLDRIAEEMVFSVTNSPGPNPMRILPYKLIGDPQNNTDFSDEEYRFYIFYILCRLHYELDDFEGVRKLLDRYEGEFQSRPYYGKMKALSLMESADSQSLSKAITEAFNYSQEFPDYPDLHRIYAKAIVVLLEEQQQYVGSNPHIPKDEQDLLEIGILEIDKSLEEEKLPAESYIIKARLETLNGEFDTAKRFISRGRSELSRSRTSYTELRSEIGRIETRIETYRQQRELEKETDEISQSVEVLENDVSEAKATIDELNDDLDDIRQDFQRTVIEFLGFFSAIIAVIVITGQIALEVADPGEAGKLMIVSYGGLLFAFGSFAAILNSDLSQRLVRGALALIGFLIAVSISYPNIVRQFISLI